MVTIIGGELLCGLGEGSQHIENLLAGRPKIVSTEITVGKDTMSYPYYRIDETHRSGNYKIIDGYLDRVVTSLLKNNNFHSSDLDLGVFLGSSAIEYSLGFSIENATDRGSSESIQRMRVGGGSTADRLMERFSFKGPSLTYNTACTSSANALMDAASMLEGGVIDYALVIGLEIFSSMTFAGFVAMQLLSQDKIRPFDQHRDGMVLGEAVSVVLLSRADIMPSPWHYLGGKSNCETYSVTGANPNGAGISQVIKEALVDAKKLPKHITAIKSHGTSGASMDLAEFRGMERSFPVMPAYFSLKPYIGHTLGGCGVAELLLMMECVDAGFIPPTINFKTLDREFSKAPISKMMPMTAGCFMLNYFGFGGNNTSIIIAKM